MSPPVSSSKSLATLFVALFAAAIASGSASAQTRQNPLEMVTADQRSVENCADPTVIRGQPPGDGDWYMYCTSDPLGDWDKDAQGNWSTRLIPIHRSSDLIHWTYVGDALGGRPSWAESGAGLWAPEIQYLDGRYTLYYSVTDTRPSISGESGCASDSAIAVAISTSPTGPFTTMATPTVRPRRAGTGCAFYATIDPEVVVEPSGQKRIFYGSFYGGIETRPLSADGLTSSQLTAVRVAAWDWLEGALVVPHAGFWYLMGSAAGCCNGPLSGYGVFAGRATSPTGPFLDRDGHDLADVRPGGTTVLQANGSRWVGPGHHTVIEDLAGQAWTIYHAIDDRAPYYAGAPGYTKRPAMIDPLDWVDDWPVVRGGWWASDCRQARPVVTSGGIPGYIATRRAPDAPAELLAAYSDEFDDTALGAQWSWIRAPAVGTWGLSGGSFWLDTQSADLFEDRDDASVLVEATPAGDFMVEARVRVTFPATGCCFNNAQGGLVVYGGDDDYVKLAAVSIWNARVTEFGKELSAVPAGWPRYDGGRGGAPGEWTWLRITRRAVFGGELYSASTSQDGASWTAGGTWRHSLGATARIGLVSMNISGYRTYVDHLRVYRLAETDCGDPSFADGCDDDGDGRGDRCDDDDDADLVDDRADCAAADPSQGTPPEIADLRVTREGVGWTPAISADAYDVSRGLLPRGADDDYGACLANDHPQSELADGSVPPPGQVYFYLVRGVDAGCGGDGSWGQASDESARVNANPAACGGAGRAFTGTGRSSPPTDRERGAGSARFRWQFMRFMYGDRGPSKLVSSFRRSRAAIPDPAQWVGFPFSTGVGTDPRSRRACPPGTTARLATSWRKGRPHGAHEHLVDREDVERLRRRHAIGIDDPQQKRAREVAGQRDRAR